MTQKIKLLSTLLLFMITSECLAVPAYPKPVKVKQPDGTFVTLQMRGDEYLNYVMTEDGYTVVQDDHGFWTYASQQDDGSLVSTGVVAHDSAERTASEWDFVKSTPKGLVPKMSERMVKMRQDNYLRCVKMQQQRRAGLFDFSNFRGLVILVEFNDMPFRYGDETYEIMNDIINKENYKGDSRTNYKDDYFDAPFVGSVFDYFRDNSNGLFRPKFDIVGPVKVNRSQYFSNKHENFKTLAKEVLDLADPLVDFSNYDLNEDGKVDLVYFIFSGYGSNIGGNDPRLIWPHRHVLYESTTPEGYITEYIRKDGVILWDYACSTEMMYSESLPMLSGIGTICHEFSHVLGLPDFYDTDNEGSGGLSETPGDWSLMASGSYVGYGRAPSAYSLFERYLVGFIPQPKILETEGTYSIHDISTNEGFFLNSPNYNEYFVIENRQKKGWNAFMPGHGMMVYRVDLSNPQLWTKNVVNTDPNNMHYQLLFANGFKGETSSYDPFPGKGNVRVLLNNSSPANLLTNNGNPCDFVITHIAENDGVISFKLEKADLFESNVVPDIASLFNLTSYEDYMVQLKDAQVYVVDNTEQKMYVLAHDATGNVLLYNFGLDVQPGDILNGRVYANYINDKNWMVLVFLNGINYSDLIQVTKGEAPKPQVVTFDELDSHKLLDYIKMRGVKLGYRNIDDTERLCIINGEQVITLNTTYFNFDIPLPSENEVSEKNYDVEGVISYYNYPGHNDAFLLTAPLIPSDETAINTISVSHNDAKTIYNLNGQRISSLHKGFNIVNGRKVWVK